MSDPVPPRPRRRKLAKEAVPIAPAASVVAAASAGPASAVEPEWRDSHEPVVPALPDADGPAAEHSGEPGPGPARIPGLLRLVHPFPSTLTALATALIAVIAGAEIFPAVRLAGAMLALQFAIGAANDLADAGRDRRSRPSKPIPAGLVTLRRAQIVFVACAIAGLTLAASVRPEALALALAGLADGLLYDLRLKGRALSWLPMAVGVALLPVFAWVGATGHWPVALVWISLVAFLGGASLATLNALADVESDKAAGVSSIAIRLGWDATLAVNLGLLAVLQLIVGFSSAASEPPLAFIAVEMAGVLLTWLGWRLAGLWDTDAARRGWELQAVGIALIGIGWLGTLAASGAMRIT